MALFNIRFLNKNLVRSQRYTGFTLAEVLITLGIIGVVAAMTIPTLMNKTNEKEMRTAWKKEFSVINQAWERVKQDEGGDLSGYFTSSNTPAPLVQELGDYLLSTKSCNVPYVSDDYSVCGTASYTPITYKTLSGGSVHINNFVQGQYLLNDGAHLFFRMNNIGDMNIWVDVNGYGKKPNVLGKDMFGMLVTKDKILPLGVMGTGVDSDNGCKEAAYTTCPYGSHCAADFSGVGCSAKYLLE